jgi:uncharacterized protein (DUF2164 family)
MRPKRANGTAAMHPMAIEISKQDRQQAIESLMRYAAENFDERMGNVGAGALLGFFLEEIGPLVYNQAVADVQERLLARVQEVDLEVHQDAFQYWRKFDRPPR